MTNTSLFRKAALTLAVAAAAAPAAAPASAQGEGDCVGRNKFPASINVVANGIRNNNGKLVVTIYPDDRKRFLASKGEINVGKVDAQQGTTRAKVCIPGPGVYAIAVYHDEDGGGKFDRGLLPKEGFGFSNNPSTIAGLPSFSAVRLNVSKSGLATHIQMKYP
ncbi:DUF2141 domain-containing protein [Erythrobacter sp. SG61-1L]|uniref:DUF2141 domain-containing protein n=1 Tax=Erythrobacter sp. SG61-1L TaxID=1603897 RepID=UPI0006C8F90D|nr:DUF2141 domain-containing protein [Erythrobacter sp. SG61-1L]